MLGVLDVGKGILVTGGCQVCEVRGEGSGRGTK